MSDEPRNCTCDDWKRGMNEIEAAQTLAWTHGMLYTAPPFRFCPWCGKELIIDNGREIREALARYSHDSAWSGWMKYMFSKGNHNPDGTWTMPASFVERWTRQMNTLYDELPESEKTSDRAEADKILAIVPKPALDNGRAGKTGA